VFRWLDSEAFQAHFVAWTQQICTVMRGQVVAADGKKLRRSQDDTHERDGSWLVSACASENRMVLGQRKVDDKSNEITAIPSLLATLVPHHTNKCMKIQQPVRAMILIIAVAGY
jgi:hypothetical protein